jgi:hypothetical protein
MLCALFIPLVNEKMMPPSFPIERVRVNVEASLKKAPNDANLNYVMGRIHYTLLCNKDPQTTKLYTDRSPYSFPQSSPHYWDFQQLKLKADAPTVKLARDAISFTKKAIQLDPKPAVYPLTLACIYEASANIAGSIEPPKATKATFLANALRNYTVAFNLSAPEDRKQEHAQHSMTYEPFAGIEAANAILRLAPKSKLATKAKEHIREIAKKPGGPITPIIFSLESRQPLADLLDSSVRSKFDLSGTAAGQTWSWVKPKTGFLVWQASPRSRITSGRQLFGSATFWLMFSDGYEAMSSLDDNHDGWLKSTELNCLGFWRDRNQNGIAEPLEVQSIRSLGIAGIATTYTDRVAQGLANPNGLLLESGQTLPTYDWITEPLD